MTKPFDENPIYFVYLYIRKITSSNGDSGTPYYVGKGKNNRHLVKHNRIRVPHERNRIVIVAKSLYEYEAFILEKKLIEYFGRIDLNTGILHNLTSGGEGLGSPGPTTRKIQSNNAKTGKTGMLGKKHSEITKLKMSKSSSNKKKTETHCLNISKSKKGFKCKSSAYLDRGKKISLAKKGKSNGRLGTKHKEETKIKIRNQKGWKHSNETKEKMGLSKRDNNLYLFSNKNTKQEFFGTRFEFQKFTGFDRRPVHGIITKCSPSYKGWIVIDNKE